jgi:LPXTG-motif cell wall-anchored protein
MTSRKLASAAAAASLAGVAVLGMGAPALAQTSPCYPPPCSSSISDSTVVPGQTVTVTTGSGFAGPGGMVGFEVLGLTFTRTADATGKASLTFKVPAGTAPGRYFVNFSSSTSFPNGDGTAVIGDSLGRVPFTVVAAAAANPGQGQRIPSSGLPLTGSDQIVPLTVAGIALVGIGAGIVVASRRRRETSMPGGFA